MTIQGNNPAIDELLSGNDKIVYNLVSLIRGQDGAKLHTDGRTYLTAQSNGNCPAWLFVNAKANGQPENELFSVLSEALE